MFQGGMILQWEADFCVQRKRSQWCQCGEPEGEWRRWSQGGDWGQDHHVRPWQPWKAFLQENLTLTHVSKMIALSMLWGMNCKGSKTVPRRSFVRLLHSSSKRSSSWVYFTVFSYHGKIQIHQIHFPNLVRRTLPLGVAITPLFPQLLPLSKLKSYAH